MQETPPSTDATWPDFAIGRSPVTANGRGRSEGPLLGYRTGDLTATAYERIEELFVRMELGPGAFVRTQDIQVLVGLGRTPVHQAVRRLAAETLLDVRPRNGLRVSPIDLSRERHLSVLRRDLNRFVTEAAMRNMNANDRSHLKYLRRQLLDGRASLSIDGFNDIDKALDTLLIHASGERFLERTLRPLHAIARRIGYLHLTHVSGQKGLDTTIERHLAIMDAVINGDEAAAIKTSDELIAFSMSLIDEIEEAIDPCLLDAGVSKLGANCYKPRDGRQSESVD